MHALDRELTTYSVSFSGRRSKNSLVCGVCCSWSLVIFSISTSIAKSDSSGTRRRISHDPERGEQFLVSSMPRSMSLPTRMPELPIIASASAAAGSVLMWCGKRCPSFSSLSCRSCSCWSRFTSWMSRVFFSCVYRPVLIAERQQDIHATDVCNKRINTVTMIRNECRSKWYFKTWDCEYPYP